MGGKALPSTKRTLHNCSMGRQSQSMYAWPAIIVVSQISNAAQRTICNIGNLKLPELVLNDSNLIKHRLNTVSYVMCYYYSRVFMNISLQAGCNRSSVL